MGDLHVCIRQKQNPNFIQLKKCFQEHNLNIGDIQFTRLIPSNIRSIDVSTLNLNSDLIVINTHKNALSDHLDVSCNLLDQSIKKTSLLKESPDISPKNI